MKQSLETADRIVKLVLAILVVVLYLTHIISGPFAKALVILALSVLIIFGVKVFIKNILTD